VELTINVPAIKYPESLRPEMIAPCGMDCGLCARHLREKDGCGGCRVDGIIKPRYCVVCRIRDCEEIEASESGFCFECAKFPCTRLQQLDKRYRTTYRMSMVENLERVRELGLEGFVASEKERWRCSACGGVVCVHKETCIYCGHARS
jgi:hypothetical protein